jgi:hypothetical protein
VSSFIQAFEEEITNLEQLFKDRWDKGLAVFETDDALMTDLKDLKFKIEFECGMSRKFLASQDYTNALINFGLASRNYGVFFHEASRKWRAVNHSDK